MDISWSGLKVAVFVDGCFWHSCPAHSHDTRTNSDYWTQKLDRNRNRDRETDEFLIRKGWVVLRFWEHVPSAEAADAIEEALATRRQQGKSHRINGYH